jgi:cell wall assembly regulator SMI1
VKDLRGLIASMDLAPGASEDVVRRAEQELGATFPAEYVAFMSEHNGGEGPVGQAGYAKLWPVEELTQINADYAELDHLDGWVIFGSNMGGEAYVFDRDGQVLMVPWIGSREDAAPQGSFSEFLHRVAAGTELG